MNLSWKFLPTLSSPYYHWLRNNIHRHANRNHEYYEIDRGADYIEYECAICKKHYTEEIEAEEHEHEYVEAEVVEPTETEDGYILYECECGDYYEEILPATGTGDDEETEEGSEETWKL